MNHRQQAHARRGHPGTSVLAAKKASNNAGGLKVTQQSVMLVMRMVGRPMLDEELIREYGARRKALMLPQQSESGIRSRRSELSKMGKLTEGGRAKMTTGGTGMTWGVAHTTDEGDT